MKRFLVGAVAVVVTAVVAAGLGVVGAKAWRSYRFDAVRAEQTQKTLDHMGTIEIGGRLPDNDFEDLEGNRVRLSTLVREGAVLSFFRSNCGHCLDELDSLRSITRDSADFSRVILISHEDRLDLKQAAADLDIRCPILWDRDNAYAGKLRVTTQPFNVVVDSSLTIIEVLAGAMMPKDFERLLHESE
ncbi:MAG: redoxin domain-containing protein [bacterium]